MSHTMGVQQTEDLTPTAGQRSYVDLDPYRNTRALLVTLSATVAITGVATAVRNRGSVAALFDNMGLDEAGTVTGIGDPRSWAFASEFLRGSTGTRTRLSGTGVATTNLVERILIPMEYFWAARPRETQYLVKRVNTRFRFFVDLNGTASGLARIVDGGTAAISNVAVKVQQIVDNGETQLPLFAPRWSEIVHSVPSTNGRAEIPLNIEGDYLRGMTILQDATTSGLVSDIISTLQLRTDRRFLIGEGAQVNFAQLAAMQEFESGGDVFSSEGGAIVHLNFQKLGRLSNIISPADGPNLRIVASVAATGTGTGSSQIKILLHRLSRDSYQGPDGRRIVSPALEIPGV